MAAKVTRPCQRNDCPAPARAGVELSSADKVAVLVDLAPDRDPRRMELCGDHAAAMTVPRGWSRVDERRLDEVEVPEGPPTVAEIASLSTLDVITAALGQADGDADADGTPTATEPVDPDDGPSVAAVMAAALANPGATEPPAIDDVVSDGPVEEPDEVAEGGTQLSLAPEAAPLRRARPVPAASDADLDASTQARG